MGSLPNPVYLQDLALFSLSVGGQSSLDLSTTNSLAPHWDSPWALSSMLPQITLDVSVSHYDQVWAPRQALHGVHPERPARGFQDRCRSRPTCMHLSVHSQHAVGPSTPPGRHRLHNKQGETRSDARTNPLEFF